MSRFKTHLIALVLVLGMAPIAIAADIDLEVIAGEYQCGPGIFGPDQAVMRTNATEGVSASSIFVCEGPVVEGVTCDELATNFATLATELGCAFGPKETSGDFVVVKYVRYGKHNAVGKVLGLLCTSLLAPPTP